MIFFGNLGYFHNVEPARFLAAEVLPRVRAGCPRPRLQGRRGPTRRRRCAARSPPTGAELVDTPPDLIARAAAGGGRRAADVLRLGDQEQGARGVRGRACRWSPMRSGSTGSSARSRRRALPARRGRRRDGRGCGARCSSEPTSRVAVATAARAWSRSATRGIARPRRCSRSTGPDLQVRSPRVPDFESEIAIPHLSRRP